MIVALLALGCASQRPVLYPNAHYRWVGQGNADADVDRCLQLAAEHGVSPRRTERVGARTVRGGAVGAATGAAVGAVAGRAGRGAAAGAAGGAAAGLTRAIFDSGKPDPTYRRFVEHCLEDLGYQPVGWR